MFHRVLLLALGAVAVAGAAQATPYYCLVGSAQVCDASGRCQAEAKPPHLQLVFDDGTGTAQFAVSTGELIKSRLAKKDGQYAANFKVKRGETTDVYAVEATLAQFTATLALANGGKRVSKGACQAAQPAR